MATVLAGAQVSPSGDQGPPGPQGIPGPVGSGSGDVNGPASAVTGELAIYSNTSGKLIGRLAPPAGSLVGTTATQTLTGKTLTSPVINSPTGLVKGDVGLANVDNTSDANKPVSTAQQTALNLKEDKANKAIANGYASLDATGKVPSAQLPPAGLGDVVGPASSIDGDIPLFSGTTGKVIKQSNASQLAAAINPIIWNQRSRSFNTIGNPNFEVDQIYGAGLVSGWTAGSGFYMDRWWQNAGGGIAMATSVQSVQELSNPIYLPGTGYVASSSFFRYTLTTQDTSLAAGEYYGMGQSVEGSRARELYGGPHSISLLVRSSVANLKFSVALTSYATPWRFLVKLCTMAAANTWTLITLPNLPVWDSGGTWSPYASDIGYYLYITLACGSTYIAPSLNTWLTGAASDWWVGAAGMDNFGSKPLGSTFDIAYVQHEPGSECTMLMPKSFEENYQECQRYYQKSYNYWVPCGTNTGAGYCSFLGFLNWGNVWGTLIWPVVMAKVPGLKIWTPTGTPNGIKDAGTASVYGMNGNHGLSEKGLAGINIAGTLNATSHWQFHWQADTSF